MRKSIAVLLAGAILMMAGSAWATLYSDTYNPSNVKLSATGTKSISWTFDLTKDGFNPVTQDVNWALVTLNLADDLLNDGGIFVKEFANLSVGTNTFNWEVDYGTIFSLTSIFELSNTGKVGATLTATGGDFWFNAASLCANGVDSAPVPEPGTMMLLGAGMLGLVIFGKRRMNKEA